MTDEKELPFVIRLLDDESPKVREAIAEKLVSYGDELDELLKGLPKQPLKDEMTLIRRIVQQHWHDRFREMWPSWQILHEEDRLEAAMSLLSDFQDRETEPGRLKRALDFLADGFRETGMDPDGVSLANYLFKQYRLSGSSEDFYNPGNSNLNVVIKKKQGLPISLACIYMLVGKRVGIPIEGLNYPGYFLAKTEVSGKTVIVDCFNRGRLLEEQDLAPLAKETLAEDVKLEDMVPDATQIVMRVLRNLIRAYQEDGQTDVSRFLAGLLEETGNPTDVNEGG